MAAPIGAGHHADLSNVAAAHDNFVVFAPPQTMATVNIYEM
jgi:hypothetical protein